MKTKLYTSFLLFAFLLLSTAASGQYNVLMVGDPADSVDIDLTKYLTAEGYTITGIAHGLFNTSPYDTPEAYYDYDAVLFSEVMGSGSGAVFRTAEYPIPALVLEGFLPKYERWYWMDTPDGENWYQHESTDFDRTEDLRVLVIDDNEHYITRHYEEGEEVQWTTAPIDDLGVTGCKLDNTMSGPIQLAHFKDENMAPFPCLWAVPGGSSINWDGAGISNNIVIFGVIAAGQQPRLPTDDYYKIIKRSLEWVTDNLDAVEDFSGRQGFDLRIMPNPTSGIVDLSFALNTSGTVQVEIYDITGKRMESIESGYLDAGRNRLRLDFTDKPDAAYIISLITESSVLTRKVIKK
jgi:hypothetical protein